VPRFGVSKYSALAKGFSAAALMTFRDRKLFVEVLMCIVGYFQAA
jgi:hypothetical protein